MNKAHDIDKSNWPKGPWNNEPDRIDWVYKGFSCMMIRNTLGNWCGYVAVPSDHPSYKKDYDDVYVDVHGGLTYSDKCQENGVICHVPEPGMPDDVWWLGFDCGHSGDYLPGLTFAYGDENDYKDVEYVRFEVISLADQLKDMTDAKSI
jgi:hypothetical protein